VATHVIKSCAAGLKPTLIVALSALVSGSCASAVRSPAPMPTTQGVRFAFVDTAAQSVAIAGSFNNWSPSAHPLARGQARGAWTAVVSLPPGEYLFMYVVNGTEWVTPPRAEDYADDGFGAKNGVLVVRPTTR
jgi:1,4-alpha-glucan branching enzyme